MNDHEVEYSMFEENLINEIHQLHITIAELEEEVVVLFEELEAEKNKVRKLHIEGENSHVETRSDI